MGVTGIEIAGFPTRFSHFFSVGDSVFLSFLTIYRRSTSSRCATTSGRWSAGTGAIRRQAWRLRTASEPRTSCAGRCRAGSRAVCFCSPRWYPVFCERLRVGERHASLYYRRRIPPFYVTADKLDLNATQQFNEQRGLTFRMPA